MERQTIVYKHTWVIDSIHQMVSNVSHEVTRTDKLEHQIVNSVGGYLLADTANLRHKRYLRRLIAREIQKARKQYRIQESMFLSEMESINEDGQAVEYEPEDVLANVESKRLEVKETITLLAQGDRRRKFVLNAWANGFTDSREISGILADTFGGNSETHRKFIQRFKTECRAELTAQAI